MTFPRRTRHLLAGGIAFGLATSLVAVPLAASAGGIDGVWQSDGYGSIVAIGNGVAKHYAITSISCTPAGESRQVGRGIPPHVRTPVFTDEEFAANRDSAFDTAVTLLRH